ncbi:hypothetical protein ACIBSV_08530 [Embleya sp. NPDC050154]|uniref:hypothetical protein n=1 Tax=Embleya sp. NPDC050154 TaxID=3363988 RepID=UPI0037BC0DF3
MSTKRSDAEPEAVDEDAVARELYGLSPDEFTAARDAYAARARKAGNRAVADRIGKLRRPVQAAWLANLLVREQRAEIEAFLELGAAMRQAQEHLQGPELRELSRRRHQVIDALQRQAQALAATRGHPAVADSTRRALQDTLAAALADPAAARALAAGTLAGALEPTGDFGPLATSTPPGATPARKSTSTKSTSTKSTSTPARASGKGRARHAKDDDTAGAREATRRAAERERHEARLTRARADLEAADTAAEEAREAARVLEQRADAARDRHREALADAEDLERRLAEARDTVGRLDRQARDARRAHEDADELARIEKSAANTARARLRDLERNRAGRGE